MLTKKELMGEIPCKNNNNNNNNNNDKIQKKNQWDFSMHIFIHLVTQCNYLQAEVSKTYLLHIEVFK